MPGWSGQKGVRGAAKAVSAAVASWPGTRQEPHRFGGIEFLAGEREIGHLHGDRLLDVPFPRAVHGEIIAATKAEPHHIMPDSELDQLLTVGEERRRDCRRRSSPAVGRRLDRWRWIASARPEARPQLEHASATQAPPPACTIETLRIAPGER